MHNSRILNNPLNWSTELFQLSSRRAHPCSGRASCRVGQEATAVPLPAPPGHVSPSAPVFSIFGTVNQRKERKYLESCAHNSMSGSHTEKHHGDCPSTGDYREKCACTDLPLPKPAPASSTFETTEGERARGDLLGLPAEARHP